MKLKIWWIFTAFGTLLVTAMTAIVGFRYGQMNNGYIVDLMTVVTAFTMTAMPLLLGWQAGYWYAGDQ